MTIEDWVDEVIQKEKDKPVPIESIEKCHKFYFETLDYFKGK